MNALISSLLPVAASRSWPVGAVGGEHAAVPRCLCPVPPAFPADRAPLQGVVEEFGGLSRPHAFPLVFDAVRVGRRLGLLAISHLLKGGEVVGPYLACSEHPFVLIPVELGTADTWLAAHSDCIRHSPAQPLICVPGDVAACESRAWVDPLGLGMGAAAAVTTGADVLHDALSLQRSPAVRRERWPVSEVCRV
ncbi:hypothetical protein [Streptomyces sp. NPDC093149]|uniref:hypothetical protein n=1 Tax=Streptomyces sp. NPDC093149 TaxID=3366031 RepID=UPI0038284DD0